MAFAQAWAFSAALVLSLFAVVLPDDYLAARYILALWAGVNLFLALWA